MVSGGKGVARIRLCQFPMQKRATPPEARRSLLGAVRCHASASLPPSAFPSNTRSPLPYPFSMFVLRSVCSLALPSGGPHTLPTLKTSSKQTTLLLLLQLLATPAPFPPPPLVPRFCPVRLAQIEFSSAHTFPSACLPACVCAVCLFAPLPCCHSLPRLDEPPPHPPACLRIC